MPPNELQKQAIEYLEGPLLVIAGPGTGKTQLLSKKVDTILLGFEDAKKRLPKAKNIVITGTPTKIKKVNLVDD